MQKVSQKNANHSEKPPVLHFFGGLLTAFCITAIVFIIYALLLTYTEISENQIPLVVALTTIVCVIVAGFDAARSAAKMGIVWGAGAGLAYAVILLALSAVVNRGISADSRTFLLIILSLAGGAAGGIISANVRKK